MAGASSRQGGGASAEIAVLLRVDRDEHLLPALLMLFSFSILRAMEAIERAPAAGVRRAITHQVIEPLERGRAVLLSGASRRGRRADRLLLPASVVTLAERQIQALRDAVRRQEFPWDELPQPLQEPDRLQERLLRARGFTPDATRQTAASRVAPNGGKQ